jgi:hypothetical protein
MGIIQCSSDKDKNNIWDIIEKSINNKQSTLYRKIYEEYYMLKDLLKPIKLSKKNENNLTKEKQMEKNNQNNQKNLIIFKNFSFITPKKRMKFFTKWYIMSHPNQIIKNKKNKNKVINNNNIIKERNFYNSSNSSLNNNKENLRASISTEKNINNKYSNDGNSNSNSNNNGNNNSNSNNGLKIFNFSNDSKIKDRESKIFSMSSFNSNIYLNEENLNENKGKNEKRYNEKYPNVPNELKELKNLKNEKEKEKDSKFNTNFNNNSNNNFSGNFRKNLPPLNKNIVVFNLSNNINNNNPTKIKITKTEDYVKIKKNLNFSESKESKESKDYSKEETDSINLNNFNKQHNSNFNFSENDKRNSFENTIITKNDNNNNNNINININISDQLHLSNRSNNDISGANSKIDYSNINPNTNSLKSNINTNLITNINPNTINKDDINSNSNNTNTNNSNTNTNTDKNNNYNYNNNYTSSIENLNENENDNEFMSNSICQNFKNFNIFDDSNIIESNLRLYYNMQKIKFLKRVAKGPPSSFRWISWIIASDLPLERSWDYYNYLLNLPIDQKVNLEIKKDMNRTLCGIKLSNTNSALDDSQIILYNTLRAFAQVDKKVSYCQGMNFIVGFLLVISDFNELETFYLILSIFSNTYNDNLGIRGFFLENFPLGNFYVEMFLFLFEKNLPELNKHFIELGMHEESWVAKWFRTLFTLNLPFEFVMRIWDCIFLHGLGFLLNFTLAFMKYMEKDLLNMNDLFDVLEYFKKIGPFYLIENEGDNKIIKETMNFLLSFDIEEIIKKALKIKIDKNLLHDKMKEYEKKNNISFENLKIKYDVLKFDNNCSNEIYDNEKREFNNDKNNNNNTNYNVNKQFSNDFNSVMILNETSKNTNDCLENSDNDSDDFKEGIDDKISKHTFKTNIKKLENNYDKNNNKTNNNNE